MGVIQHTNSLKFDIDYYKRDTRVMQTEEFKNNFMFTNKMWNNKTEIPNLLADTINTHNSLILLSISNLDDDGCITIAETLRQHKQLETLHITGIINKIGDPGCIAIAKAVKGHKKLKTLNFSHNNITTASVSALVNTVKSCPSFTSLILTNNKIDFRGANTLIGSKSYQMSFTDLCITNNSLSREEYESLNISYFG
jgi:hypothetical protein